MNLIPVSKLTANDSGVCEVGFKSKKNKCKIDMKKTTMIAIFYVSFFGAITAACIVTKSAWPLLAMVFIPNVHTEE
jgi:hypothetical protein